jgi:outer membrane protein
MRIALCSTLLIGALAGTALQSEESSKPQSKQEQIVLIDMAKVFNESREFADLRDDLKADIQQSETRAKQMATNISQTQALLKGLAQGTADHATAEKELTAMTRKYQDFRKDAQRKFLAKESQIYRDVYMKVRSTVQRIAEQRNCALVIRFDSKPLNSKDPQQILKSVQRQVIYYREQDDITGEAIEALNDDYEARAELDR